MFDKLFGNKELKQEKEFREKEIKQNQDNYNMSVADSSSFEEHNNIQAAKSDLIRWQQDMDIDLFRLTMSFLSLTETNGGLWIPILDGEGERIKPLCNKLFIHQVVEPKLRPFMSKNLINSNLDGGEIRLMQLKTADDITDMMSDNWDKYEIDFVNYNGVLRDIKNVMRASVWRCINGFTKKQDNAMSKRVEMFNESNEDDGKGFLAKLFG